jgi:hypothetical protein
VSLIGDCSPIGPVNLRRSVTSDFAATGNLVLSYNNNSASSSYPGGLHDLSGSFHSCLASSVRPLIGAMPLLSAEKANDRLLP